MGKDIPELDIRANGVGVLGLVCLISFTEITQPGFEHRNLPLNRRTLYH